MTELSGVNRHEVQGYEAVRAAAKDYETYSSDLLGDRDVRSYRQLPLEADPPRHTQFRSAMQPLFMSAAIAPKAAQFEQLAIRLIEEISAHGGGEIGAELALPYVMGCLTIIYNRPQDFDEWVSWGPDVWTAEVHAAGGVISAETQRVQRERDFAVKSQRSGRLLDGYLTRVFDAAKAKVNTDPETMDAWDFISQLVVDGKSVTREEMHGIANVLLAGGRDTVIKLITGFTWQLIREPADRAFLATNPEAFSRTIAEMVRYLTPLPKMERVLSGAGGGDQNRYVLLSFVSANFDRSVWPDPDRVDIHRERKPNLAFGFGRHSCMGMNITEHETGAFLRAILQNWPGWQLDGEPEIEWATEGEGADAIRVIDKFNQLRVVAPSPSTDR